MTTAILTLPFHENYGGYLQSIALYSFLEENKANPILISKRRNERLIVKIIRSLLQLTPGLDIRNVKGAENKRSKHFKFLSKVVTNISPDLATKDQLSNWLAENGVTTIIIIEHNLDVIKTADWIIDLGPEGGSGGGNIVASGSPEAICSVESSYTGKFLKPLLKR